VPMRMPFPPALNQGSIYENQTSANRRYFQPVEEAATK
jgi:phytanoyl-CoA hydroxylase